MDLFKVNDYDLTITNNNFAFTNSRIEHILTTNGVGNSELERAHSLRYFHRPSFCQYPINLKAIQLPMSTATGEIESKVNCKVEHYITATVNQLGCNIDTFLRGFDFCTQREALQRIMLTPYQTQHSWVMMATKYNGKIYLNQWVDENCVLDWNDKNDLETRFERLCFAGTPSGAKLDDKPCKLYTVNSARLKDFNLLWSSEIAGVNNDKVECNFFNNSNNTKSINKCNIIVPKLLLDDPYWYRNYDTMLEIVTEAYLTRAREVCVGFSNPYGIVSKPLRICTLDDLCEFQPWKLHCCIGFLYKFLLTLNSMLRDVNNPYKIYVFRYNPRRRAVSYKLHTNDQDHSFLSQEYINAAWVPPPDH